MDYEILVWEINLEEYIFLKVRILVFEVGCCIWFWEMGSDGFGKLKIKRSRLGDIYYKIR